MFSRVFPVVVLAVLVAWAAYFTFAAVQKRFQQAHVRELVADTTVKLRTVLVAKTAPNLVASLDANLKKVRAPRDPRLAAAAELYIVSAREIARRRVEIGSLEQRAAASRQALATHVAHRGRRGANWMDGAVALKNRVEDDHFKLDATLKALDQLLSTLPESERPLAPLVRADALIDEDLRLAARAQAQEELRRARDDLEGSRRLR